MDEKRFADSTREIGEELKHAAMRYVQAGYAPDEIATAFTVSGLRIYEAGHTKNETIDWLKALAWGIDMGGRPTN